MLPEARRKLMRFESGFAYNYQIKVRVDAAWAGHESAWQAKECLQDIFTTKSFTILGKEPKVGVEISPMRRAQTKAYFGVWEAIKSQLATDKHTTDGKALAFLDLSGERAAWFPHGCYTIKWGQTVATTMGLDWDKLQSDLQSE